MIWPAHLITYITITIGPDLIDISYVPELVSTKFRKARGTQLPQKTHYKCSAFQGLFFPFLGREHTTPYDTRWETSRN